MLKDNIKKLVWDYKISPDEFMKILKGENGKGWPDQDWAIARVLTHMNYYDAKSLVPVNLLSKRWQFIKPKLFPKTIKDGYEFVLRRHSLSIAG